MAQKYSDPSRASGQSTDGEAYEPSPSQNGAFPGRSDRAQTAAVGFEPSTEKPSSGRTSSERIGSQSMGNKPLLRIQKTFVSVGNQYRLVLWTAQEKR